MLVENTFIKGLNLLHYNKFLDSRGFFYKPIDFKIFKELDFNFQNFESFFSISKKNVIRGMHLQTNPNGIKKFIYLTNGSILDVILDVRPNSETYGKYYTITLNLNNPVIISIPYGCAHGFLSLEENSIITYFESEKYNENYDFGLRYDSFGFKWPVENPIVSERDKSLLNFNEFKLV